MNKVTLSGNDGFWTRVRTALSGGPGGMVPAYGQSSIHHPGKKARPAQLIDDDLRRGWTEAAERKVSLCVLALEMDGYAEYFAAYGRDALEDGLGRLEEAIGEILPREDFGCLRSGRAGFMLILPDMPGIMGREMAARIARAVRREGLPHRESHAGHVTLSMGLAVVNPEGPVNRDVLEGARQAVAKAQRRGIGRLEIVDYRVLNDKRQKAA
jgi:diguanylate cyclase (GGDEF)-like protein